MLIRSLSIKREKKRKEKEKRLTRNLCEAFAIHPDAVHGVTYADCCAQNVCTPGCSFVILKCRFVAAFCSFFFSFLFLNRGRETCDSLTRIPELCRVFLFRCDLHSYAQCFANVQECSMATARYRSAHNRRRNRENASRALACIRQCIKTTGC